jgi:predicted AAA+ superfamily ATPase
MALRALPRLAGQHLAALVGTMKVAVVTGARQTGKSTLVRSSPALEGYAYLSLDNLDLRQQAREAPRALLTRADRVIVDEIQHEPDLLPLIKELVDDDPPHRRGRFVLTGSANLLGLRRVGESLAGRAGYTTLWPLTRREVLGKGRAGLWGELHAAPASSWKDVVLAEPAVKAVWSDDALRGGYPMPAVHLVHRAERELWFQSYIDTYLHRDVPEVSAISSPLDLHRLMKRVVLDLGQVEHQARWATELGLSRPTVGRWLDLLEVSYQLVRIPAWTLNRRKQLVKARKIYWVDAGLACALAGERNPTGAHLENLVLTDLRVWQGAEGRRPEIYHWRTRNGHEVDLVIEYADGALLPIEVKAAHSVGLRDARGLGQFLSEYPEARAGLLLYGGDDVFWLTDSLLAAPWWRIV